MQKKVNNIYDSIMNENLSMDAGVQEIVKCVFLAPRSFGLTGFDPDQQSEFLLSLYPVLPRYIQACVSSRAQFSTYLTAIILNMKKSWFRNLYRNKAQEKTMYQYCIQEDSPCIADPEDCLDYMDQTQAVAVYRHKTTKTADIKARRLLILALKSCYYLTPDHISLIAKKTAYSETDIYRCKEKLEQAMKNRIDRYKLRQQDINTSFILKNRCLHELNTLEADSPLARRVLTSYQFHSQRWQKKLQEYKQNSHPRPTNKQIAEVLNIKVHQVYQDLRRLKVFSEKYPIAQSPKMR